MVIQSQMEVDQNRLRNPGQRVWILQAIQSFSQGDLISYLS